MGPTWPKNHCATHYTLNTKHFTLHTTLYTLHTIHYTLNSVHREPIEDTQASTPAQVSRQGDILYDS